MILRGVKTPLGIIPGPLEQCRPHTMIPRGVWTPLGIIACPLHAIHSSLEGTQ